jgi:hypothetical protein
MAEPTRDQCHEMVGGEPCREQAEWDWYPEGEAYVGTPLCWRHALDDDSGGKLVSRADPEDYGHDPVGAVGKAKERNPWHPPRSRA